jgi:hypothetical protein
MRLIQIPSLLICLVAWLVVGNQVTHAFSPTTGYRKTLALHASPQNDPLTSLLLETHKQAQKAVTAVFVAGALWAAPATMSQVPVLNTPNPMTMVAFAKEMASASGSRVNKDPESLLRYGLPIDNKEVSTQMFCILLYTTVYHTLTSLLVRFDNCKERLKISSWISARSESRRLSMASERHVSF